MGVRSRGKWREKRINEGPRRIVWSFARHLEKLRTRTTARPRAIIGRAFSRTRRSASANRRAFLSNGDDKSLTTSMLAPPPQTCDLILRVLGYFNLRSPLRMIKISSSFPRKSRVLVRTAEQKHRFRYRLSVHSFDRRGS